MTNEKAVKVFGRMKCGDRLDSVKKLDAIILSIESLEKQIPQKPINMFKEITGSFEGAYEALYCPERRTEIHILWKHCPECGQRIDWEDENEK